MADDALVSNASVTAPKNYTVPQAQEIVVKAVRASIDGTSASGTFLPALQMIAPNGDVMWTAVDRSNSLAAGASADVTWFPRVGGGGVGPSAGTGVPPAGNLDGYIFRNTNLVVSAVGHSSQSSLLIQGNPVVLDGATSILVQYFCPSVEITTGVVSQGAAVELWDNFGGQVDKGTIGLTEFTISGQMSAPMSAAIALTPAAGTHTYALYAWKNINSSTVTFYANTFVDGTGNIAAMSYRIIVIPFDSTLPS